MARAMTVLMAAGAVLAVLWPAGTASAQSDEPEYPSESWFARETENYAMTQQEPTAQTQSPAFQQRWREQSAANFLEYRNDAYHNGVHYDSNGNLCATWSEQCVGEPFLYPSVDEFYEKVGEVRPVSYYDSQGALLLGYVWAPRTSRTGDALPGVVIETGSVQAPEPLYRWFAQTLVRNGYIVMTYDVRGQGRSDSATPDGTPGSNFHPDVFVTNLVDTVDFFHTTPDQPYANNESHTDLHPGIEFAAHNPYWDRLDRRRLGIVGHSLGARGVSVVQGLDPWIGQLTENPVDVAVAWDNLRAQTTEGNDLVELSFGVTPRVPAMGQSADYGLTPQPKTEPPDPDEKVAAFEAWQQAGLPTFEVVVRGGTHYEWSYLPTFPSTSWGHPWSDMDGWGNPMVEHYSLAWLDRWLKEPDEPGHGDADARLLQDRRWCPRLSFYYRSARDFPDRAGTRHLEEDLRASCLSVAADDQTPDARGDPTAAPGEDRSPALPASGGGIAGAAFVLLALALIRRGAEYTPRHPG